VTTVEVGRDLPLTLKEQAQWRLHRLTPGKGICNLGMALKVDYKLRWWPLQETLNHLLRRHQALRGTLRMRGSVPRKFYLREDIEFPLSTVAATDEELPAALAEAAAAPFDIDGGLLVRARLVLTPAGSAACIVLHHIVADYTSFNVLLAEFAELYQAYADAAPVPPGLDGPAPTLIETDPEPETVAYWTDHLAGVDAAAMSLSGARPIQGLPTFAGAIVNYAFSPEANAAVQTLRARTRMTVNIVLLTAFFATLARHGAGPDLVVGVPVNGRKAAFRDVVGFHASTLPIRVDVDPRIGVGELTERVSRAFLLGLEHATASFEAVQFDLDNRSADWRTPLFRHLFNFRPVEELPSAGGSKVLGSDVRRGTSRLDVELEVWPFQAGIEVFARYSEEVHDREQVESLLRHFDQLLVEFAAAAGDTPIGELTGWSAADRALADQLNATSRAWPAGTVLTAIRAAAANRPDSIAIRSAGAAVPGLSYADLLMWAASVAAELRNAGVRPTDVVGIYASRGAELAAAVLGAWSVGAAYLALDPAHPVIRLADELDDSGVAVILAADEIPAELAAGRATRDLGKLRGAGPAQPDIDPADGDIAYVSYTSGSTGRPKGCEVTHGNLANVIQHFAEETGIAAASRMLWLTTYSFDISALELLMPLTVGGTVVVAADEDRLSPARLIGLAEAEGVTIMQATPTTWRFMAGQLRGRLPGLVVLTGGEEITGSLAGQLLADDRTVLNVYGPTETTIWSTCARLNSPVGERVPIGRPIANTTVYVMDGSGYPVPPGVAGELCIGGRGVARGYRNAPELTSVKFRDDAVRGRYYRTGDLVRLTSGGLEFLGRIDRQVKVRGHRVELAEVEAVLAENPDVRAAVVLSTTDSAGDALLVAAVQSALTGPAARDLPERLRARAARRLPAALVPARYTVLPSFPVTGNNKVDQRGLLALLSAETGLEELPDDELLATLVLAWRSVLGADGLGADANFFLCGGHSLLAARLAAYIGDRMGTEVGFEAIFTAPTPRKLAELLRQQEN
jgi:amino acid adenylation domain-containing protein